MILSLKEFDECVHKVLDVLNYKHLNREIDYFENRLSSGEIIIQFLWQKLKTEFSDDKLFHLKLWETNNNYFETGKIKH